MLMRNLKARYISVISSFILIFFLCSDLRAQGIFHDLKTFLKLNKCAYYTAIKGDTPYSVSKRFNLSLDDLYIYNPDARQGIREGDELKIPTPFTMNQETNPGKNRGVIKYVVGRSETLYSISRLCSVTQEDILKANPTLKGSLTAGTVLVIPGISSSVETPSKPLTDPNFRDYTIITGDTYYLLQQKFGASKFELEKLNPELKDGLKLGQVIKIPISRPVETTANIADKPQIHSEVKSASVAEKPSTSPVPTHPVVYESKKTIQDLHKTFEIGIYLPFCQNYNDSARSAQHSNNYMDFYSGVLLASEKMIDAGMKLRLFVYDTYHDSDVVATLVKKPEFLSLDLIIGPVYPNDQKIVAELSYKNHIPMVSPLSPDNRFVATTPGYYLINPGKMLRLASTADYVSENFASKNLILLNHGADSEDEKYLLDRITRKIGKGKIKQYNILTEEIAGFEELLKDSLDNIFILAENSEANVSVAMTRLNTVSKTHKVKVIGLQEYTKMQSIDVEYLHNTNLSYLAPYYIDYGNVNVNSFIEKYRTSFGGEPSQYSFQGFDIAMHFFASLSKAGKHFPETNPSTGVELLQGTYNFTKPSQFGGYINNSLYVIEYSNNYEVRIVEKVNGAE